MSSTMVSSSKILTVSYGTFSCTAEGFDDPLEAVKEATQFFRGVVGEDRFFGAEPPQFDPELASEYLRDRLSEPGSGTLSLGSPPRVMAAAASAGAMAAAMKGPGEYVDDLLPDDDTIEATAVLTETPEPATHDLSHEAVLDDLAPDGTEAAPAPQPSAPDDIAAKLDRIRAVVASTSEEDDRPVADDADLTEEAELSDPLSEQPDDSGLETLLDELVVESGDTEVADLNLGPALDDADDDLDLDLDEDGETDSVLDAAVASLMAGEPHGDQDSPVADLPKAEDAALSDPTESDDLDAALSALAQDDEDIDPAALEAALDEEWAPEATIDPLADSADADAPVPTDTPPVRARIVKVKRAAFEQAIDQGTLEEVVDDADDGLDTLDDTSSLSPEEEEELARELAAVKAELASDFGAWDEDDDAAPSGVAAAVAEAEELDDEDEDSALAAAVAEAMPDQDMPLRLDNPITDEPVDTPDIDWDDDIEETVKDSARKAVKLASPARALLTEREVGDTDTSRLLDQTNTEMDEPEGNRRRSAIAHLRAAVAATKADRLLGRKADAAEEQEPYREDLASVVRPRRPQSVSHNVARPAAPAEAPSPLKLVAEQRVAGEPEETATPVRPRRVRRTVPAPEPRHAAEAGDAEGFAAYARDMGAAELPELLEAAAAYMSYVEGRDQFSRPQLMTTLRQAEVTDSSREDRLRSFGQLLREGKIRKTSGGRFTAADSISFKPAANG
ncbi:hypothetical protein KUV73_13865 [Mameliella alba]|nr:hypothetical protein [Mameliella alba]MBY6175459.1 hypothetical protein [Mameliella alba]